MKIILNDIIGVTRTLNKGYKIFIVKKYDQNNF